MQTHFRNKWSKVCCPPVQMWLILRLDFPARREQEVISVSLGARDACPIRHRLVSAGNGNLLLKGLPTLEKSAIKRARQVVTLKISFGQFASAATMLFYGDARSTVSIFSGHLSLPTLKPCR